MRKQITRPGHTLPSFAQWGTLNPLEQDDLMLRAGMGEHGLSELSNTARWEDTAAMFEREERHGRLMTNLAGVALALCLAAAGVALAIANAPAFGSDPEAGYVPGLESGRHVL